MPGREVWVRVEGDRPIGVLDPDSPAPARVTGGQGVGADLIDVITTGSARADGTTDRLDGANINDRLASGLADAVDGGHDRQSFSSPSATSPDRQYASLAGPSCSWWIRSAEVPGASQRGDCRPGRRLTALSDGWERISVTSPRAASKRLPRGPGRGCQSRPSALWLCPPPRWWGDRLGRDPKMRSGGSTLRLFLP
jgi:hypothetical protein